MMWGAGFNVANGYLFAVSSARLPFFCLDLDQE